MVKLTFFPNFHTLHIRDQLYCCGKNTTFMMV